jgi:cephalosporin hydroxylase
MMAFAPPSNGGKLALDLLPTNQMTRPKRSHSSTTERSKLIPEPELFSEKLEPTIEVRSADGRRELDIYTPEGFASLSRLFTRSGWQQKISYEVTWLGIPIIQTPEDILMMQELIWKVRPDVIIECGVAHGGALMLYASMLDLLGKGHVLGIDVEIRKYNRLALQSHPLSKRYTLIEASSIESATVEHVKKLIHPDDRVLVAVDSNHTKAHVARELELYAPLVSVNSYIVVFDGVMEVLTDAPGGSPTWATDNPWHAVREFLSGTSEFEIDPYYNRLKVTYLPGGFLKRIRDPRR